MEVISEGFLCESGKFLKLFWGKDRDIREKVGNTWEKVRYLSGKGVFSGNFAENSVYFWGNSEIKEQISEGILRDRHFFRNPVGKQISDGNKISLGNFEGKKISEIILKFNKNLTSEGILRKRRRFLMEYEGKEEILKISERRNLRRVSERRWVSGTVLEGGYERALRKWGWEEILRKWDLEGIL